MSNQRYLYASSVVWQAWLVVPTQQPDSTYGYICLPPENLEQHLRSSQTYSTPTEAIQAGIVQLQSLGFHRCNSLSSTDTP